MFLRVPLARKMAILATKLHANMRLRLGRGQRGVFKESLRRVSELRVVQLCLVIPSDTA